jgi:hypothetical protein
LFKAESYRDESKTGGREFIQRASPPVGLGQIRERAHHQDARGVLGKQPCVADMLDDRPGISLALDNPADDTAAQAWPWSSSA